MTASTLLVRDADRVETFDDASHAYDGASVFVRGSAIESIGPSAELPRDADVVVDARGMIVLPGLVNTHHHFYQTLTRNVPGTQNVSLFDWLVALYPIWARITPEMLRSATRIALAELLKSGCTTAFDHMYMWPNGCRIDDQIEIAREMGVRFHAARGSMSVGHSRGGLPPDDVVEDEAVILRDCERAISTFHDDSKFAMRRIVLAPCSPFSVSLELMRETIKLGRAYGVHVHTHLVETLDEQRYVSENYGRRPVELAEHLGWLGKDVWFAHVVHASGEESALLGRTHTGIAHCPSSNMRLGSGIAPIGALQQAGARIGLGVDGAASNDSSHMLSEARIALLLQRVGRGAHAMSAKDALYMATRGGASVLGRDDIGALAPGMAADIIGFRLDTLELAGSAIHDPLAALVFCRPPDVDFSIVNGNVRIQNGAFVDLDVPTLVARHNVLARELLHA